MNSPRTVTICTNIFIFSRGKFALHPVTMIKTGVMAALLAELIKWHHYYISQNIIIQTTHFIILVKKQV